MGWAGRVVGQACAMGQKGPAKSRRLPACAPPAALASHDGSTLARLLRAVSVPLPPSPPLPAHRAMIAKTRAARRAPAAAAAAPPHSCCSHAARGPALAPPRARAAHPAAPSAAACRQTAGWSEAEGEGWVRGPVHQMWDADERGQPTDCGNAGRRRASARRPGRQPLQAATSRPHLAVEPGLGARVLHVIVVCRHHCGPGVADKVHQPQRTQRRQRQPHRAAVQRQLRRARRVAGHLQGWRVWERSVGGRGGRQAGGP